jgi:hypothetical protein
LDRKPGGEVRLEVKERERRLGMRVGEEMKMKTKAAVGVKTNILMHA